MLAVQQTPAHLKIRFPYPLRLTMSVGAQIWPDTSKFKFKIIFTAQNHKTLFALKGVISCPVPENEFHVPVP